MHLNLQHISPPESGKGMVLVPWFLIVLVPWFLFISPLPVAITPQWSFPCDGSMSNSDVDQRRKQRGRRSSRKSRGSPPSPFAHNITLPTKDLVFKSSWSFGQDSESELKDELRSKPCLTSAFHVFRRMIALPRVAYEIAIAASSWHSCKIVVCGRCRQVQHLGLGSADNLMEVPWPNYCGSRHRPRGGPPGCSARSRDGGWIKT